jgi:hypothetical protein
MLGLIVLAAGAAAWAALLRAARCPGGRLVGGVVCGFLLGPAIFGRAFPALHETLYLGGAGERGSLHAIESRLEAHAAAGVQAGITVDPTAVADLKAERERAAEALRAARDAHDRPRRIALGVLTALMLLGAAAHNPRSGPPGQAVAGSLSVGAWSAALPGGIAFIVLRQAWDVDPACAAIAAAAVGFGPWALSELEREAADGAELGGARTIESAGQVATAIALVMAIGAVWHSRGAEGLGPALPLLAAPLSWLPWTALRSGAIARPARLVTDSLVIPAAAAATAVAIDPVPAFSLWPIVLFLLLSGDGRWLGALIGARILGGRRSLRTMRLVLGSMSAGPTQLAVVAVGLGAAVLSPRYALALLLGAAMLEATAPLRRTLAARLAATEREVEAQ